MTDQMNTKTCPYCFEEIRAEATRCRHCRSYLQNSIRLTDWYRDLPGRKVLGVAEALGIHTPLSAVVWRLLFVIFSFIHGIGIIAYLVMWSLMPYRRDDRAPFERIIRAFSQGFSALRNKDTTRVEQV